MSLSISVSELLTSSRRGGIAGQQREQAAAVVGGFREHGADGLHIARALDLIRGERDLALAPLR